MGGKPKIDPQPLPPPGPRVIDPTAVAKAKDDLKMRLRAASSRKGSNVTGVGLLIPENTNQPKLRSKL